MRIGDHSTDRRPVGPDVHERRVRQPAREPASQVEDRPIRARQLLLVAFEHQDDPHRRILASRPAVVGLPRSRLTFQLQVAIGRSVMLSVAGRYTPEAERSARACTTGAPASCVIR